MVDKVLEEFGKNKLRAIFKKPSHLNTFIKFSLKYP